MNQQQIDDINAKIHKEIIYYHNFSPCVLNEWFRFLFHNKQLDESVINPNTEIWLMWDTLFQVRGVNFTLAVSMDFKRVIFVEYKVSVYNWSGGVCRYVPVDFRLSDKNTEIMKFKAKNWLDSTMKQN